MTVTASDEDPGGTGARQLQGARARRRVFNTPTPGVYRHDMESGTTWAGVAAENAKERLKLDGKKTNTIVVGLMRENNNVRYQMTPEEVETLIFDNIGLNSNKLVWFDDSYFRTLMFGVELDVNLSNLKLGISHKVREGLKTKACHPIADTVTLRIYWTEYTADREAITEALEKFGKVEGEYRNQTFPKLRKDGTASRLANVLRSDLIVRFKPTKMLPSYIRVKGKKIKVSFENQTTNCSRCYRFPVKVGNLEPCLGKLDPNLCGSVDPKGESYKYNFDVEWEKLLREMEKIEEMERPMMSWDSGFVTSEDIVEITNVPEDVTTEEAKQWIAGHGIVMDENVQIKQSSFPGTMKVIGLDAELAEQIKSTCWGKTFGTEKRAKRVFVDLVRDNTREDVKVNDKTVKVDDEAGAVGGGNDEEDINLSDLVTDDEETTDDDTIFATLAEKTVIDEVVTEAMKLRKERIVKQMEGWKHPEGGLQRSNIKEMLLDQQITAAVMKEVCMKAKISPDEQQAKTIRNKIRKRTRLELGNSPPFKVRQQSKKQKSEEFKTPVLTKQAAHILKPQSQPQQTPSNTKPRKSRSRSGSTNRSRSKIRAGLSQSQQ